MTYRPVVYSNVIQSMMAIVRAMGQLKIDLGHPDRSVRVHALYKCPAVSHQTALYSITIAYNISPCHSAPDDITLNRI